MIKRRLCYFVQARIGVVPAAVNCESFFPGRLCLQHPKGLKEGHELALVVALQACAFRETGQVDFKARVAAQVEAAKALSREPRKGRPR
eukprot:CAMPEP_0171935028 /NCGR_PEP_ID=MMETSP0993-20121228/32531_1 /TAXON_ID=483369 /ORGANISM="non described non described, Strain CCMP2098" /LENGTH=88 /DNA_ID=CAMNT_0012575861 /DNA_START=20 /DNA_END=286 /DNA_ORIENTATION=-